jgi:ABC-type Fe3+ transport system permease subunit
LPNGSRATLDDLAAHGSQMISPALLERPGAWRGIGIAAALGVAASPGLVLLARFAASPSTSWSFGAGFQSAIATSLIVAGAASICALVLGMPCGLLAGLYRFRVRQVLLAALALPLLLPSFIWAIGLSMLRIDLGISRGGVLSGIFGVVWSFAALGTPLVVFTTLIAVRLLPAGAVDAARIAGGERAVLHYCARAAVPAALAAAIIGGLVSLADPGPAQIFGVPTVATQILVSFSALYDFELAARQGFVAALIVVAAAAPVIWFAAGRLILALRPREIQLMSPRPATEARFVGPFLLAGVVLATFVLPVAGIIRPAFSDPSIAAVQAAIARTSGNTLYYALLAGLIATTFGLALALCSARFAVSRAVVLGALTLIFVVPPAVGALGIVFLAGEAPAWLDPVLRSRFTVAGVLGLRLTAIATVVLLRAIGSASPSWALAATVHGVSLASYGRRVLAPFLLRPILTSIALVGLVATADITTVLLLQPPGRDSLPVAIFTVMANAPESMVATLCAAYLLIGCGVIFALMLMTNVFKRQVSL